VYKKFNDLYLRQFNIPSDDSGEQQRLQDAYDKLFESVDEDFEDPALAPHIDLGINENEFVVEFGPETQSQLSLVESSFKLLWDGSLSVYKDNVLSSAFNKALVARLLDFRARTQNDDEPPVTLLHGAETEQVLRHSLMRIRVEQQEEEEERRRKAREAGEEVEDEEDQITMTNDESRDEVSTFQQDMHLIADFLCFDVP